MKRIWICALLTAGLALPAFAQDAGDDPGQDDRRPRVRRGDRQRPADGEEGGRRRGPRRGGFEGFEGGPPPGGPGGPGGAFRGRMFDHIADDLDLDEEQRAAFDEIADGVREQMRERWDGMRGKVEELREAADSGNYELADQIRRELEDSRGNPGEVMDNAIAQLEPILRPAQVTRLHEMRDDMRRREDSRDFYRRVARDLPDELNMTDEQRDQYDEILDGRREQMRARFDEMRPLFEEMREAREAGNMDRVNELRDQLRANRPDENALQEDFFTQVDTILTDEQRAALADFREWNAPDAAGDAGAATTDSAKKAADVRDVIRAAHRVRLAPDQRDELKEIERDAMRDYRAARRDPAKAASLADRVKAEVLELLDDNQTEDFQNRLDGRGNRPARKARRG